MMKLYRMAAAAALGMYAVTISAEPMAEPAAKAACAAEVAPTDELAAWTAPVALTASGKARKAASLTVGQAADVTLLPTPQVAYVLRPEKPGGSVSFGGLVTVEVNQAANYRVALSSGAWIDLVRGGNAVTSVAHGHGPECSGVRKMVDFPLTPGRYTLQIGAQGDTHIRVLVARLP